MSKASAPSPATSPSTRPVTEPAKTNPVRLGILLGLLAIVLLLLAHHYTMAAPATDEAYIKIEDLFRERNAKGVTGEDGEKIDAKLVKPADIQEVLNKKPWYTDTQKDHTVECYWWYGMPHRNYITVLYYGSGDKLRFNTHYKNAKPPAEDLPGAELPTGANEETAAPPTTTGEEAAPAPAPMSDAPAAEGAAKPAEEKPAEEKPAEAKPAEEKPADKPAEDKPAEEKPAEEKPADK
ncbi:hypothetical protein NA78x_003914 [Anatilimnocola sp. NA78]|uniref:hypothetical protein n=1 Tax=Anatilimnocola sp. NA78 TaxID=3415683 RepID=UPI003CE58783